MFNELIKGLDKSLQATLCYMYQKEKIKSEYQSQIEKEKLKKEIVEEVLANISVTVDVTDILEEIEAIQKAIDNLTKGR